jgi:hypothetical protein
VTSACLVLGLAQIGFCENPRHSLERSYAMVSEFNRAFESQHGTLLCRRLIGYDLTSPEGLAAARESKVFTTVCPGFVADAVHILEGLLDTGREAYGTGGSETGSGS